MVKQSREGGRLDDSTMLAQNLLGKKLDYGDFKYWTGSHSG